MENEFSGLKRAANALQALVMAAQAAVLVGVENVKTVFAGQLGLIHRLVGLAQQLVGIDLFGLWIEGHTETRRDLQYEANNMFRLLRRSEQTRQHWLAGGEGGQVEQHSDKFVAAQTGERIAFTQRFASCGWKGRSAAGRQFRARADH